MSKSIKARLLCAAAASLLLSACATVGPDFVPPATATPAGYAAAADATPSGVVMSPDARPAGPWWTALGSAELDAAIRQALADSPTVSQAAAAVERANADLAAVRGAQGVQVSANASAQRERINTQAFGITGFPSPTINLFSIGGAVSYDLDLFGGQRRAAESAQAGIEAESRRADAAYLALSGNVALQAVRIAALSAEIETVNSVIAADQRQIEMVRQAERAGGEARSAATVGEAQLARDQALLPPLQRSLAAARHQLALLVGHTSGDWTAPRFSLEGFRSTSPVPVSVPSSLVHARPDILAAEADLHRATARIGVATAELYPDIRLNVGLTQTALAPENIFNIDSSGWNVGPSVRLPLFDRSAQARQQAAVADARLSLARYQGTVLRAFLEVSDALSNYAEDQKELDALRRAETVASANVRDAETAYRLGGGPQINIVDAQRRLGETRRQIVQLQGRLLEDQVTLYTASGASVGEAAL